MNIVLSIGSIWLWHSCVTCVYIHVFCMSVGMMFGNCYMDYVYWVKCIKMFALFFSHVVFISSSMYFECRKFSGTLQSGCSLYVCCCAFC